MKQNDTGRREFLAAGLTAGLVALGCDSKRDAFLPEDATVKPSGKMVKLLSSDGEVIEVDQAFLKPVPDLPPVPNAIAREGIPGKKFVMAPKSK